MIKGFMNYAVVQSYRAGHKRDGQAMIYALFHNKKSAESCAKHMNRINLYPSVFKAVELPYKVESDLYDPAMFYGLGDSSGECIADQGVNEAIVDIRTYRDAMRDISGSER